MILLVLPLGNGTRKEIRIKQGANNRDNWEKKVHIKMEERDRARKSQKTNYIFKHNMKTMEEGAYMKLEILSFKNPYPNMSGTLNSQEVF